jgi:hypothetical protein
VTRASHRSQLRAVQRANRLLIRWCWWSLMTIFNHQYKSKMGEIKQTYTHTPLLLTYFHMYGIHGKISKGATQESVKQTSAREPSKSPSKSQIWAEHQRGQGLGPPRNGPREGSHEAGPPRCGRTRGATTPQRQLSGLCSSGGCMPPCIGGSQGFPYFLAPN